MRGCYETTIYISIYWQVCVFAHIFIQKKSISLAQKIFQLNIFTFLSRRFSLLTRICFFNSIWLFFSAMFFFFVINVYMKYIVLHTNICFVSSLWIRIVYCAIVVSKDFLSLSFLNRISIGNLCALSQHINWCEKCIMKAVPS